MTVGDNAKIIATSGSWETIHEFHGGILFLQWFWYTVFLDLATCGRCERIFDKLVNVAYLFG